MSVTIYPNPFPPVKIPLPRGPFLIIYNSDPALGSGTSNWSYQVASWYAGVRAISATLYPIDFSKCWDGSASGYTPANDAEWNGGLSDNGKLWTYYTVPVANLMTSIGAVGVLMSAGTPTLTTLNLVGEPHAATGQWFANSVALYNYYNTAFYGFTMPNPLPQRPSQGPSNLGGSKFNPITGAITGVLIPSRNGAYRPDLQAIPTSFPDEFGIQGVQANAVYNNFNRLDKAQKAFVNSGDVGSSYTSWGMRPHGRIGRPTFFGSAGIPPETDTLAYQVVNQALHYQRTMDRVVSMPVHVGISTRQAPYMTDYEGAALYNWLQVSGLQQLYYYTYIMTGSLAAALTPTARESYSRSNLVNVGVGPYPAWAMVGYALENTAYTNTNVSGSWQMDPGAFGWEGTSFGWNHIARIQLGGGVGGVATLFEPGSQSGLCDFMTNIMQGMSLMEANWYSDDARNNGGVWAVEVFGDPLYTPVINVFPYAAFGKEPKRQKKEKRGPLYLAH